ncbi:MAG: hypothetical protein Q9163_003786 [Psora crenata]
MGNVGDNIIADINLSTLVKILPTACQIGALLRIYDTTVIRAARILLARGAASTLLLMTTKASVKRGKPSPRLSPVVTELEELRPRRPRSRSVSFVEEPEEIVLPRPPSPHGRLRLYYDGARSRESETKNLSVVIRPRPGLENNPLDGSDSPNGRPKSRREQRELVRSAVRPQSDEEKEKKSTPRSLSGARDPQSSRASDMALGKRGHLHSKPSISSSRPTRFQTFVDDDEGCYTAGPLGSKAKEDPLRYAPPVQRNSRIRSRTSEDNARPRKRPRRYCEASSHAGIDGEEDFPSLRKYGYRHLPALSVQIPRANPSANDTVRPSIPITPDHPAHPDHLAYLLSAHHITPIETAPGEWEYYDNRNSPLSAVYSPPVTPTDAHHYYYDNPYGEKDGCGRFRYDTRTASEMDYDEIAYYEAKGREYMQHLEAEKAGRDGMKHANA